MHHPHRCHARLWGGHMPAAPVHSTTIKQAHRALSAWLHHLTAPLSTLQCLLHGSHCHRGPGHCCSSSEHPCWEKGTQEPRSTSREAPITPFPEPLQGFPPSLLTHTGPQRCRHARIPAAASFPSRQPWPATQILLQRHATEHSKAKSRTPRPAPSSLPQVFSPCTACCQHRDNPKGPGHTKGPFRGAVGQETTGHCWDMPSPSSLRCLVLTDHSAKHNKPRHSHHAPEDALKTSDAMPGEGKLRLQRSPPRWYPPSPTDVGVILGTDREEG